MSYITTKRVFYVNSHNRRSGTHSQFSYVIDIPKEHEFTHCCLLSASIPKSYYLIRSGKNTFTLNENKVMATIAIPIGNYSASSFKSLLQTQLNTVSPNGWNYTIVLNASTGKYNFTVTGNADIQPSFITTTNVYEQLGLEPNTESIFVGGSLTSANVIKFQLEENIYLHSNLGSNGSDDILNELFVSNSTDYSTIKYQCPDVDAYSKELQTINSTVFSFCLTNEDNEVIELNGLNVVFVILLYRKETVFRTIKDYIKIKLLENK